MRCTNNWCNLYNDCIAVCSFSDLCFPDVMINDYDWEYYASKYTD